MVRIFFKSGPNFISKVVRVYPVRDDRYSNLITDAPISRHAIELCQQNYPIARLPRMHEQGPRTERVGPHYDHRLHSYALVFHYAEDVYLRLYLRGGGEDSDWSTVLVYHSLRRIYIIQ